MFKKVTFGVKSYFFRKKRWFSFKGSKSPKNIKKRVIYAVLEKNKYIVVKRG